MASINNYLTKILEAKYGEEVRGSIHDAIEAINNENTSTSNKINNMSVSVTKLQAGDAPTVKVTDNGNQKNITFGIPLGDAIDVRINGSSIVSNNIADIPFGNDSAAGVVSSYPEFGTKIENGKMVLVPETETGVASRSKNPKPITSANLDYAVKAAMCDGKGDSWSTAEQAEAQKRIGVRQVTHDYETAGFSMVDGKLCVINDPVLLDETGVKIADILDQENAYLAMLAEGKRADIYNSMSQIASIVRGGTVETNKNTFPIGDQIVMPWKDMDDPAHNTDETAYQVEWDIVHHGLVTLQDGSIVPGMYLMMHKCSPYGVQFSHPQAFYKTTTGLPAGTYHVTFGATWGSKGADAGTSWQFTLTQPLPAGGRLSGFEGLPDQVPSAWRVKSWASPTDAEPIETVVVAAGAGGASLGTMLLTSVGEDGLNSMQAAGYGHNRWGTSAIRQYLNSAGVNWCKSMEDFDIRPDQYNKHGFMSGFGSDFLSAIKPVKVTTALNLMEGFSEATEDTFDTFFLPSLEQINAKPQLTGAEGDYFEYWRRRLGLAGFSVYDPTFYEGYKIPAINSNSPKDVCLRSANLYYTYHTWFVNYSGGVHHYRSRSTYNFAPVCVVC